MENIKKVQKNIYYAFMGILFPLLYHLGAEIIYMALEYVPIYNTEVAQTFLEENPQFVDALFCLIMILISLPFYLKLKNEKKNNGEIKEKIAFKKKDIVTMAVIAFGCGGVSVIWLMVSDSYLHDFKFMADSIKDFEEAFPVADNYFTYFWSFLSIVLFGPIVEEIMFRGISFEYFSKIKNGWFAIIISGVIFGLWHMLPVQVVYTGFQGIVLGYIYYKKKNILFPLVIHFINNFTSELPPFMNNDYVYGSINIIKFICIIPAAYLLVKMSKDENWRLLSKRNK